MSLATTLSGCVRLPVTQGSGKSQQSEVEVTNDRSVMDDANPPESQQIKPSASLGFPQLGVASWYGTTFNGHRTASGERFNMNAMTAAHKTLPLGSYVRVTLVRTGRSIIVRINDRGPFSRRRIIDLSYAAASALGIQRAGTGLVAISRLRSATSDIVDVQGDDS
ncbi:septal ring lytic transglycosylase RlpA family protein [Paraburkholderia sp. Tr-20389]|nr:septal ring lytic transglycosylase RlpA family protein [Paraburkholderia sp. Tr-20389]MBN3753249.1 septal ring lytic transglycosylase RlpA family protein [Paraburkholderia sp. Tr-20389]